MLNKSNNIDAGEDEDEDEVLASGNTVDIALCKLESVTDALDDEEEGKLVVDAVNDESKSSVDELVVVEVIAGPFCEYEEVTDEEKRDERKEEDFPDDEMDESINVN